MIGQQRSGAAENGTRLAPTGIFAIVANSVLIASAGTGPPTSGIPRPPKGKLLTLRMGGQISPKCPRTLTQRHLHRMQLGNWRKRSRNRNLVLIQGTGSGAGAGTGVGAVHVSDGMPLKSHNPQLIPHWAATSELEVVVGQDGTLNWIREDF